MTPAFSTSKLMSVRDSANFLTDSTDARSSGTEQGLAIPGPLLASFMSCAVFTACSTLRAGTQTSTPRSHNKIQVWNPMPAVLPVTRATPFVKRSVGILPLTLCV